MRKIYILFLLLSYTFILNSQNNYALKTAINYYEDAESNTDAYKKSNCILNIYYPTDKKEFTTVIWIHGGSLTGGKLEIPEELKNKGYAVVGIEYRLSPKVKAQVCIEDAAAAVALVFKHIEEFGGDKKLIFVSGHSAGAYLGLMVTLNKSYLNKYNVDADNIAGLIALSGQVVTHFTIRKERGIPNKQLIIDEFAPLYYVRENAPQIALITGDADKELLGRYEENALFWRMMKLVGHKNTRIYKLDGFNHTNMVKPGFTILNNEISKMSFDIKPY
jgi:acetyl esterase/lipase